MKLCRFDLISEPGVVRSGVVYAGKVYETDGVNPIAVHETASVRLLTPVGLAPSVRLFAPSSNESDWTGLTEGRRAVQEFCFAYLNASNIVGPQFEMPPCTFSEDLSFRPCLACVVSTTGPNIPSEEADQYILGLTLANVFFAADLDRLERMRGQPPSRSHDVGIALGPAIVTPDELEEALIQDLSGRRYKLGITGFIEDKEVFRFETSDLPFNMAELVAYASESCPVRAGDILLVALGEPTLERPLETGLHVRVANDRLGALVNRVG